MAEKHFLPMTNTLEAFRTLIAAEALFDTALDNAETVGQINNAFRVYNRTLNKVVVSAILKDTGHINNASTIQAVFGVSKTDMTSARGTSVFGLAKYLCKCLSPRDDEQEWTPQLVIETYSGVQDEQSA